VVAMLGDEPTVTIDLSIRSPVRRREARLICRDGVAVCDDAVRGEVLVARGPVSNAMRPVPERRAVDEEMPLLRELGAFVNHVRGGPPPRSSIEDSLVVARAIEELRALAGLSEAGLTR
jgi:predicted dehydrogenase